MALVLNEDWTAYVAGEMHRFRIRNPELAEECGYHKTYLSTVLNGNKDFGSEEAAQKTRQHILNALERLKAKRMEEVENAGSNAGSKED